MIVAMITSQASRRLAPGLGDVVVEAWRRAGLRAASTVRVSRLLVIEQRLVDSVLGHLPRPAMSDVEDALRDVFAIN